MNSPKALEEALQALAAVTAATQTWNHYLLGILLVLIAITLVGFCWVGHEIRATNLMVQEVLRRTPAP